MVYVLNDPGSGDPLGRAHSALFAADLDALAAGPAGTGVVSGCALTLTSGLGIAVASGVVRIATVTVASSGATVTATNHATLPRWGIITTNGTPTITMGTAAASPDLPDIPAGHVLLGSVYLTAALTTLTTAHLNDDKRVYVPGSAESIATQFREQRRTSDLATTLATAVATGLTIPVGIGEFWRFKYVLATNSSGTGGIKVSVSVPTGMFARGKIVGKGGASGATLSQFWDSNMGLSTITFCTEATTGWIEIEGGGQETTVAGNIQANVASGVAGQTTTILGYSFVFARRVA